ncbi:DUF2784 domain-containing protein [Lentzea chajnantorensis]
MAGFLAGAVVLLHFAVLAFLLAGGFLAWHWRRLIYPHLALAAWAVLSLAVPTVCPLTTWENDLRAAAGMPVLETGFIDHYIDGVWYPESASTVVQLVLGAVVVVSWAGFAASARTARRVGVQ